MTKRYVLTDEVGLGKVDRERRRAILDDDLCGATGTAGLHAPIVFAFGPNHTPLPARWSDCVALVAADSDLPMSVER